MREVRDCGSFSSAAWWPNTGSVDHEPKESTSVLQRPDPWVPVDEPSDRLNPWDSGRAGKSRVTSRKRAGAHRSRLQGGGSLRAWRGSPIRMS